MTIFIVEKSNIIKTGLKQILLNSNKIKSVVEYNESVLLAEELEQKRVDCVIINPLILDQSSHIPLFQLFPSTNTKFIALVYSYVDNEILSQYDGVIYINENQLEIVDKIKKVLDKKKAFKDKSTVALSKREIDILKSVVLGLINQEVAEKHFISIHTVITHRKNINSKLGIKTVSGLTVYALLNNLVKPEDIA